jgi:hypothetical protein
LIVCRAVRNDKIRGLKNRQEFVVCESVAGCGVYCCNLADVGATDFVWMTARKEEGGAAADTTSRACRWSETKKKKKAGDARCCSACQDDDDDDDDAW